jgi:hypothetical protein
VDVFNKTGARLQQAGAGADQNVGTSRLFRNSATSLFLDQGTVPINVNGTFRLKATDYVTISNSGLSASTRYYVYAYWNAGAIALELSTTGHDLDVASGVEIKNADRTRTLVGMLFTNGSSEFVDSSAQRFLISWFSRRPVMGRNNLAADKTTTSSTYVELDSTKRVEFLSWGLVPDGNSNVLMIVAGAYQISAVPNFITSSIGVGSATEEDFSSVFYGTPPAANINYPFSTTIWKAVGEGYSYATLLGAVGGGATGTWIGGAGSNPSRILIMVMG